MLKGRGLPVADAEVSTLDRPGHVLTDTDGRFVLVPSPRPPFEILVALPGGRYARPIRFEAVTVTAEGAPGLESPAAAGLTLVAARDIAGRVPSNLAQVVENVAGASTVSERGGVLLAGHYRRFDDWTSLGREVFNSGARDEGLLARVDHLLGEGLSSIAWQSDFGRDIERPRTSSRTVRFSYPSEDSHRLTLAWERRRTGTSSKLGVSGFLGRYALVTDHDRLATAAEPRTLERADVSASDFHPARPCPEADRLPRLEAGLDFNGRAGLEALEVRARYDESGEAASSLEVVSIEDARPVDAGVYASVEAPVGKALSLSAGDPVLTRAAVRAVRQSWFVRPWGAGHTRPNGPGSPRGARPGGSVAVPSGARRA